MNIKSKATTLYRTRLTIIKIWKDPVGSKVIATAIIFLIATLWARSNNYSLSDIYNLCIKVLIFKIPIFLFVSLIGTVLFAMLLIKLFTDRKDPIWDEPIGNLTFKELYTILKSQNFPVGNLKMQYTGRKPPDDNLLTLFHIYSPFFNKGITVEYPADDDGYLFGVLSPKLFGFGIIEKMETKNLQLDVIDIKYQTSELGHKFFALLEKVIYKKSKIKK